MIQFLRSLIFNILFYVYTTFTCLFLLWTLLLPEITAWRIYNMYFRGVYWLEVIILGLRIKVEGLENLPEDGRYIVAAKHQSAHETMIFPLLLNDPAIIMKKGLMQIPLWGWYAKKAGMIGVDRGGRQKAITSIVEGSKRIFAQNRPLIIFPQGTRTNVTDTTMNRPYKGGISKIYEQVNCPIVPAALNTGVFWGRNTFIKKSGVITFKFLPPIPAGLEPAEMMLKLEQSLEPESTKLAEKAQAQLEKDEFKHCVADIIGIITFLIALWSGYWLWSAKAVEHVMLDVQSDLEQGPLGITYKDVHMSGYPFHIKMDMRYVTMKTPNLNVYIPHLQASAFPIPGYPLTIESKSPIILKPHAFDRQNDIFTIDYMGMEIADAVPSPFHFAKNTTLSYHLHSMMIKSKDLTIRAFGEVSQDPQTMINNGEIIFILEGYQNYMSDMIANGYLDRAPTMFFVTMLQNQSTQWLKQARQEERKDIPNPLSQDAIIIPLSVRNNDLYAGMFKLGSLPTSDTQQAISNDEKISPPPIIQSHPRMPTPPIDIEELAKEQNFGNTSMDTLYEESNDLPPAPNAIKNP